MTEIITENDAQIAIRRYAPRTSPSSIPPPNIFDEPLRCLMINSQWASHFFGVIDALDQPDTWIGTPEEIDAARQQIREALAAFAGECMVCCDEELAILEEIKILNQTIINNQLTLITNNLTTIEQNNQQIINQYTAQYQNNLSQNTYIQNQNEMFYDGDPHSVAPGIPDNWDAAGDAAGDGALCAAIERYITDIIYQRTIQINSTAAGVGLATDAVVALLLANAVWTAGLSAAIGIVVAAVSGLTASQIIAWNNSVNDPEGRRKARCCMFDNLKGGAVSFESFQASMVDCGFDVGTDESNIAAVINGENQLEPHYIAFLRMVGEQNPQGISDNCDCGCDTSDLNIVAMNDCIVTKIDDTHYRVQQSNFTVVDIPFAGVTQVYVAQVRDEFYRCVVFTGATQAQHDYFVTDCDNNDQTGTGGGGGELIRFGWNYWTPDATPTPLDTILTIECPA